MASSWTEVLVFIDGSEYDCRGIYNTKSDRIKVQIEAFKEEFADEDERVEIRTRYHNHPMDTRCLKVDGWCNPSNDVEVWNNGGHLKGCSPAYLCDPCVRKILDADEADKAEVSREVHASSDKFAALAELNR